MSKIWMLNQGVKFISLKAYGFDKYNDFYVGRPTSGQSREFVLINRATGILELSDSIGDIEPFIEDLIKNRLVNSSEKNKFQLFVASQLAAEGTTQRAYNVVMHNNLTEHSTEDKIKGCSTTGLKTSYEIHRLQEVYKRRYY